MRAIMTEKDYGSIASSVEKIIDRTKGLPENVFKQDFMFFLCVTFDELFMPLFFNHLKQYLLEVGENSFWLTAVEPDPKFYYGANFDFFGAIEFSSEDTDKEYLAALNDYPEDSPADALSHNSNLLMISSPTRKWAIYADRDADIAICSFVDKEQMERFRSIYGSDLLDGVSAAADYAYGGTANNMLKAKFCDAYSIE